MRRPHWIGALTATFRDINGDGAPDLYVCNDYWTPDRLWLNDGHGHFRAAPRLALRHTSASSMGIDFADINRDGYLDFFVLDMLSRDHRLRRRQMLAQRPVMTPAGMIENRPQIMRNTLFLNRGDSTFAEIAEYAGVEASEWSWSPIFVDIDLDGYEDLLIVAGHEKDVQDLDADAQIKARAAFLSADHERGPTTAGLHPRQDAQCPPLSAPGHAGRRRPQPGQPAFPGSDRPLGHRRSAGCTMGWPWPTSTMTATWTWWSTTLTRAAGIYRNNTTAPRLAVRLKGLPPNTQGIGAKIKLLNGAVPMQSQEVISGGRYLSGSDPMLVFAAGKAQGGMTLEVTWRKGTKTVIEDVRPNRLYEIDETNHHAAEPADDNHPKTDSRPPPLFADVSHLLEHRHLENDFDDFALQPILPRRFSQLGPGVAWCDLDGDGHEDLVIGSGKGGLLSVYLGDGQGHFKRDNSAPFNAAAAEDQTGMVVLPRSAQDGAILVGTGCYEDGGTPGSPVSQYDWRKRSVMELLPADPSSTGPLALGDIDGKGELELFVGGRVVAGRWPEAASSRIYRHGAGQWTLDIENTKALEKVGLVSGAVFSDLDGDGLPELLLACEWGPIRVFRNSSGRLHDETQSWGLDKFTGWWNGVTTGDLDGDGKLDIIASNWGLNSAYRATQQHPVRIYYGDLGGRGPVDLLETVFDPELNALAPLWHRDTLAASLTWLPGKYPTHKAYSQASAEQILGERASKAAWLQVNTLASMAFLNRGDHFEPVELPPQAQFTPAFAVTVADFDGDGFEDVFLSQNLFATFPQIPRLDAGRGLLLRGDGAGKLTAVPGQDSGLMIYGEQRGAAVADFNEDGRADLAVTQNGTSTRLFRNVGAKPGLRVRLQGPPSNPAAIGATVRLRFGQRLGPAREVHAGSGYFSQDSAVLVLGTPEAPSGLVVRWPGGKTTESPVPAGAKEVTGTMDGVARVNE